MGEFRPPGSGIFGRQWDEGLGATARTPPRAPRFEAGPPGSLGSEVESDEIQRTADNRGESAPAAGNRRSPRLRQRVAWMYYVEDMTQSAIAERSGIGRITVVRLLSEARAMNEVRISLSREVAELSRLEIELQKRYAIPEAIVAPRSSPEADPAPDRRRGGRRIRLRHAAARHEDRPRLGPHAEPRAGLHHERPAPPAVRGFAARRHHARQTGEPGRIRLAILAHLHGRLLPARGARDRRQRSDQARADRALRTEGSVRFRPNSSTRSSSASARPN